MATARTRHRADEDAVERGADAAMLSIGALSRACGVPIETLRTWERRYGYPVPVRKPSGHRVYPVGSVPRLQRIAEALARGHRAGEVVTASDAALDALLRAAPAPAPAPMPPPADADGLVAHLLDTIEAFDAERLTAELLSAWARLGPLDCLHAVVAPLVRAVGEAWSAGRLEVRHEHFLSERLGDLLRAFRLPLERQAQGPVVVLGTLPGEQHVLGLQMAALVLVAAGCRVLFLGTEVPVDDLASLARERAARAVGISVSIAGAGAAMSRRVTELRNALPKRTTLLVGGEGGAKPQSGLVRVGSLPELDHWARRLVASAG